MSHHQKSFCHQTCESPHSSSACVSHALRRISQSKWAINSNHTASSIPSPHTPCFAHGRTPKQHHYNSGSSCHCVCHERGHQATSIDDHGHFFLRAAHLCQNCDDRSPQGGCRDDCELVQRSSSSPSSPRPSCRGHLDSPSCRSEPQRNVSHARLADARGIASASVSHDRTQLCEPRLARPSEPVQTVNLMSASGVVVWRISSKKCLIVSPSGATRSDRVELALGELRDTTCWFTLHVSIA